IVPYFAGQRVRTISVAQVEKFRTWLLERGAQGVPIAGQEGKVRKYGAHTVRKCLTLLTMMLNHAKRVGWIGSNPAELVKKPAPPGRREERIDVLDAEEVRRLLAAANARWVLQIKAALYTGIREAELLGLQWGDIDWEAGELHVRRS